MKKSDYAHKWTDKQLAALEKRIAAEFKQAAEELTDTVNAYFAAFKKRDAEMAAKAEAGEITEQAYKQWRLAQIGRGKRFEALRDKVAERYTNAHEVAIAYINDATPGIYTLNRNYSAYTIEQISDKADFTLWDEQTVRRLIDEQPGLMPYYPPKRALKRGIDLAYGKNQITASITSSILQGKSISRIADDMQQRMENMSRASAIRTARTSVTAAQNAGRMDSYHAAEEMGIKLKKEWLATLDGRTRHAHAMLDGQTAETDKPFHVDGYEIMYPGDASAPGYLVYNCRCTLIAALADAPKAPNPLRRARDPETGKSILVSDMTYAQWVGWKKNEQSLSYGVGTPITDKSYINSEAYRRKFDKISKNKALNSAIFKYCKAAVIHQSGTYKEDLTILRLDGSFVGQTSGKVDYETHYNKHLKEIVSAAEPYALISIHNHGTNIPPSGADFESAGNKKYAFGIVACHNGEVYVYSSKNAKPFLASGLDKRVDKYKNRGYNILEAFETSLNEASLTYGIEWRRL